MWTGLAKIMILNERSWPVQPYNATIIVAHREVCNHLEAGHKISVGADKYHQLLMSSDIQSGQIFWHSPLSNYVNKYSHV